MLPKKKQKKTHIQTNFKFVLRDRSAHILVKHDKYYVDPLLCLDVRDGRRDIFQESLS